MREIGFGLIGCGLMGREFASAAARWSHLPELPAKPRLVAICARGFAGNLAAAKWYTELSPTIRQVTSDYRALLANPEVEAVYCAVPHHLHREIYCAIIEAGKHLMGEKPFGLDLPANQAILESLRRRPEVFARCSSQFPFFPAVQRIGAMLDQARFGRIIEVNTGFLHSSDLDPNKPLNWKRRVEFNGEYGCLGDLGMHACHVPLRAGWRPRNVRAILSKIVAERPDGHGGKAPCETWDNATLLCEAVDPQNGEPFPWTLKTQRIAPGEKNSWYVEILGTRASARFSTKQPKTFWRLEYSGGEQTWQQLDLGQETAFKTVSGGIFEFGFSDAILQMWAAFVCEFLDRQGLKRFARCATPEETAVSHRLFTAALRSQATSDAVVLESEAAAANT
jgi:predicted dehydrogenase